MLRERDGLNMENVCYGKSWRAHGFLTKPKLYSKYMRSLPEGSYIILMDSDTFWAAADLKSIWHKFDCARGDKEVVLSTEMQCWVGKYCDAADLARWYSGLSSTPSFSPFANSGIIMGKASKVIEMLNHVVEHNEDYFVMKPKNKMAFDDQYAIADYAINIKPQDVALDYHQQLLASFSVHAPQETSKINTNWGFVCKSRNGSIDMHCPDFTGLMQRRGFFHMHKDSCSITRVIDSKTSLLEYIQTLAPDPVIWHGNGVGKRLYIPIMDKVFRCEIARRNITYEEYQRFV